MKIIKVMFALIGAAVVTVICGAAMLCVAVYCSSDEQFLV